MISVAMCTYNGEKYIHRQLDSIIKQSMLVNEIVICDDGSIDRTIDILNDYKQRYNSIEFKIYNNPNNLGSVKNFEKAINLTTGDFIFLSDQDDIWANNKVEVIVKAFSNHPHIQGIFTNGKLIDENDEVINQPKSLWDAFKYYHFVDFNQPNFKDTLLKCNVVTGATLCIKKKCKEYILPFPIIKDIYGENIHHDYWIAQVLAFKDELLSMDIKLIDYRIHGNQQVGIGGGGNRPNYKYEMKINAKKINYLNVFLYYQPNTQYPREVINDLFIKYNTAKAKLKSENSILYYLTCLTDYFTGKRKINP